MRYVFERVAYVKLITFCFTVNEILNIVSGTKPQVVQTAMRSNIPSELLVWTIRTFGVSFGERVAAHHSLPNVFQVRLWIT